jgi:hypothetical protein
MLDLQPLQPGAGSLSPFATDLTSSQAFGSVSNLDTYRVPAERNEKSALRNKFPRRGTFETISPAALVFVFVSNSKETA